MTTRKTLILGWLQKTDKLFDGLGLLINILKTNPKTPENRTDIINNASLGSFFSSKNNDSKTTTINEIEVLPSQLAPIIRLLINVF
jgi:hypothetical protein